METTCFLFTHRNIGAICTVENATRISSLWGSILVYISIRPDRQGCLVEQQSMPRDTCFQGLVRCNLNELLSTPPCSPQTTAVAHLVKLSGELDSLECAQGTGVYLTLLRIVEDLRSGTPTLLSVVVVLEQDKHVIYCAVLCAR